MKQYLGTIASWITLNIQWKKISYGIIINNETYDLFQIRIQGTTGHQATSAYSEIH